MPDAPASGPWSTSAYSAPDQSPGFRLWRDFLHWQRSLNTVLRPLALTQPQFAILAVCGWLSRNDGFTTQQQVGLLTNMDRMHISQIVSRLERDRLLKRNTGDSDNRVKKITLTAAGEAKLRLPSPWSNNMTAISRPPGREASPGPAKQMCPPPAERRALAAVWRGC